MMYRQRLFMETAPKLIQGFHSADAGELYKIMFEKLMLRVFCVYNVDVFSVILVSIQSRCAGYDYQCRQLVFFLGVVKRLEFTKVRLEVFLQRVQKYTVHL